jgi:hypothetical protein
MTKIYDNARTMQPTAPTDWEHEDMDTPLEPFLGKERFSVEEERLRDAQRLSDQRSGLQRKVEKHTRRVLAGN